MCTLKKKYLYIQTLSHTKTLNITLIEDKGEEERRIRLGVWEWNDLQVDTVKKQILKPVYSLQSVAKQHSHIQREIQAERTRCSRERLTEMSRDKETEQKGG